MFAHLSVPTQRVRRGDCQTRTPAGSITTHTTLRAALQFQASVFLAFLLNVCSFYSTTLNSARTQNVVGQLKNFAAFLLGLVLFSDYVYEPFNFLGLLVGFAGASSPRHETAPRTPPSSTQAARHTVSLLLRCTAEKQNTRPQLRIHRMYDVQGEFGIHT